MGFLKSEKQSISILRGIFISFLFTLCMLIIYSVLLVYTSLSEQTIRPVIITITARPTSTWSTKVQETQGMIRIIRAVPMMSMTIRQDISILRPVTRIIRRKIRILITLILPDRMHDQNRSGQTPAAIPLKAQAGAAFCFLFFIARYS